MYDIEHYDLKFIYRPGHLQTVPDALSRMPGLSEEGDPADTSLFQTELSETKKIFDSIEVITPRTIKFYNQLYDYLRPESTESEIYELKDGKIWNCQLETQVVHTPGELRKVVRMVHKDLGYYGKRVTFYSVKQRYEVATDLPWEEGERESWAHASHVNSIGLYNDISTQQEFIPMARNDHFKCGKLISLVLCHPQSLATDI